MPNIIRYGLILLAVTWAGCLLTANNHTQATVLQDTTPTKRIELIHADTVINITTDSTSTRKVVGNVSFRQGTSLLYCDSANINPTDNVIDAFGHVHINQDDSIHTYSDHLIYLGNERIATLDGNAKMTDSKMVLTSPSLQYDMNTKIGTYTTGGQIVSGSSTLTSLEGWYYADTKDVYFKNDVVIVDPDFTLSTDTLLYNTNTKIATITVPTTINDGKTTMYVTNGTYNTDLGKGNFTDRPTIEDSTNTFTANDIVTDKTTGISIATGNMIWRDTAQKVSVLANYGIVNQGDKTVLATQKPVMILEGKSDTLFVASDTLFSGVTKIPYDSVQTTPRDTTDKRYLIAYHNVKIYSDSLQGVADSVYYSGVDSVFRMYKEPVLWASGNQLFGDTIYMFTKNQKADRLLLDQNAFIISEAGPDMYNQVKGNTIYGYFSNDQLDSMHVNGNAENIYYLQDDDSAYISINRLLSAATNVYFEKGELERVVFIKEPEATMYPFKQMPDDQRKLAGFKWVIERKPKSKYELIGH